MNTAFVDDFRVLRAIDALETAGHAQWSDGEQLMRAAELHAGVEAERLGFVRLLGVLAEDEMLRFDVVPQLGNARPPRPEEYGYLQTIRNFRLTSAGRDRARGRVVLAEGLASDTDDGRRLPGRVVEKAARDIAEHFTGRELPVFLADAGIPAERLPPFGDDSKWEYVANVLAALLERGASGRRIVRCFLGAWLDDELEAGPSPDVRAELLNNLARAGWHLRDGQLLVGEREKRPRPREQDGVGAHNGPVAAAVEGSDEAARVFLVHGTDRAHKAEVARFVEGVTRRPVTILEERPNLGATLIEKYERNARASAYAVVLLTADDRAGGAGDQLRLRARQNVILELGYFLSALGRERVSVLYEEGVELPSDINGLVYVPLDVAGGWQLKLARELAAAGFDVDLERLLGTPR